MFRPKHAALIAATLIASLSPITLAQAQIQVHQLNASQLSIDAVDEVLVGEHVRIEQFSIPGAQIDLELDRIEVLTENAQLVLGTSDGMRTLPRPDVVILSGIVAGDAQSRAYLAISPYATNGFIEQNGELISVSTGSYEVEKDLGNALRSARMRDMVDPNAVINACGYDQGDARLEPNGGPIEYPARTDRGVTVCRIAGIAVESDYEFTQRLFDGNTNASAAYLVSLMGALSEIYERDVNVRLAVPFLRVWADDSDPYDGAVGDPLDQVRNHWTSSMGGVERTLTHFFTGRQNTSYGGVAYLSVLCNENYGYGVSAYLNGFFPYPLADHQGGNWDVVVAAHELGHNFGTSHTHNYTPVIDGCGNGDCSNAFGGTIMSYCHTCSGGISNIVLGFHPRVQNTILGYIDSVNCDLVSEGISAADDFRETIEGTQLEIDALSNDLSQSCDPFMLESFDSQSTSGGTVELLVGAGPDGRDTFRYTPPSGFDGLDTFTYSILGDSGLATGTVSIDVRALRPADTRLSPLPGLSVDYYALSNPAVLPDFDSLTPYASEVVDNVNFPSTGGNFMGSERSDQVGAVLEGYVWALFDGIYTFSTNSDDGSALYIGDEMVVNNDGLHGMVKKGGTIPLRAGWHKIRIEFFENGGGAGLISTMAGPALPETELSGIFLSHETSTACSAADFNADGELNFLDVSLFIGAFNGQDSSADVNGDGQFNFFDIASFIGIYQAGCP